jgi:hypothetical protein
MKIILTERQQNLITENLTDENLRKFCYQIWNKQKKMGEDPNLDDMIYDITDIKKNTREDLDTIRPIWYEYNGGYDVLFEKLKDEIDTKEYKLVEAEFDLETKIKVVHLDRQGQFVEIMVDVDPRGTIEFHGWDEETNIDDVIYDITDIKKNTREDLETIRPIWYEYNGGYDVLFEKLKDEIDTKEYKLVEAEFDLETKIKVVHLDRQGQFVEIMVDVDPRGTIEFHGWDEETEEEYVVNDTIDAAYHEALINYEGADFEGMIRSSVYDFFYDLLEKYGIPIDVDIDLQEIY